MTLPRKIYLGYALAIVLIVIVSALGIYGMTATQRGYRVLVTTDVSQERVARQAQFDLRDAHPGFVRGSGAVEVAIQTLDGWIGERRRSFQNVRRLGIVLSLMRAQIAGHADRALLRRAPDLGRSVDPAEQVAAEVVEHDIDAAVLIEAGGVGGARQPVEEPRRAGRGGEAALEADDPDQRPWRVVPPWVERVALDGCPDHGRGRTGRRGFSEGHGNGRVLGQAARSGGGSVGRLRWHCE